MDKPYHKFRALRNLLIVFILVGVACKKGDKVPAFVEVKNPSVSIVDPSVQGTSSSNITHAWVFANDQTYGPWELPARVPVLEKGNVNLKIIAGIERNGSSTDVVQHPFYKTYEVDRDLVDEGTIIIEPEFEYFTNLTYWIENFDQPGINLNTSPNSDTTFTALMDPSDNFEGDSRAIYLDDAHPFFEASTDQNFTVPSNSATILEMNYASDQTMLVGGYVEFNNQIIRQPLVFVAPSENDPDEVLWKKIYIDLSPLWANTLLSDREFFIAVTKDSSPSGYVYLDNLKIVHRTL
jgi:hypothetical protein